MGLRRGADFLASIRDGRQVWVDGEKVADVTSHPSLAGCAQGLADIYDLQHDPAYRDLLTMESPSSGERVSLAYLLPRTIEDLVRRRQMIEFLMRGTGGVAGRLPEYMALILMGMYDARDILAEEDPAFARNAVDFFEYCRENDICLTHGFADPSRDQRLPRAGFENLKVVEEGPDGIVIRGVKAVATLAPYGDEYLGLTAPRPGVGPEEIAYYSVPVASPGLRTYCRLSLARHSPDDYPLSSHLDEMDAWVVFDNVFVPKERVFYLRRADRNDTLFRNCLQWAFYHILIRMAVKGEVLIGICAGISDYYGSSNAPHLQTMLCELIGYVEALRAYIVAAEQQAVPSRSGLLVPHQVPVTAGRIHGIEQHPRMLQIVREFSGSGILMAPRQADMGHPEIGADVRRFLMGPDVRAPERYRLHRLAWEYACDAFGSRQLLFEMHNAAPLLTNKARLLSIYDTAPHVRLAKQLAGIVDEPAAAVASDDRRAR